MSLVAFEAAHHLWTLVIDSIQCAPATEMVADTFVERRGKPWYGHLLWNLTATEIHVYPDLCL